MPPRAERASAALAFASGADRSREAALSVVEFADANAHDLDSYLAGLEALGLVQR
jgi:hypothetical protein